MNSEFPNDLPPILNPYDRTASVTTDEEVVINIGQLYENVDELLERHQLDPTVTIGLTDIFGDEDSVLYVFLSWGFGEDMARYVAEKSAEIALREFPESYALVNWAFLDTFDPYRVFNLDRNDVLLEPLDLTRTLVRDHFDPTRVPQSDYGVGKRTVEEQSGTILGALILYMAICDGLRKRG